MLILIINMKKKLFFILLYDYINILDFRKHSFVKQYEKTIKLCTKRIII